MEVNSVAEKVSLPLHTWQKAVLNACIVAGITSVSMISTGDMTNPHLYHSSIIAGVLTLLIQLRDIITDDLKNGDDKALSYSPLMFIK